MNNYSWGKIAPEDVEWDSDIDLAFFMGCSSLGINWREAEIFNQYDVHPPEDLNLMASNSPGEKWDRYLNWGRKADNSPNDHYNARNFKVTLCGFYWAAVGGLPTHVEKWFTNWVRGFNQDGLSGAGISGDKAKRFPTLWLVSMASLYAGKDPGSKEHPNQIGTDLIHNACAIGKDGYIRLQKGINPISKAEFTVIAGPYTGWRK